MAYRDERSSLRFRIDELEQTVRELSDSVRRLEVAAASGTLRGISESVADELRMLHARIEGLEARLQVEPRAAAADEDPRSIRSLVDEEMGALTKKRR